MRLSSSIDIHIRRILKPDDPALDGFVATYIDVFAEPPYEEHYEPDWVVEHVWVPHQPHCILVAEQGPEQCVIGLACCHVADADTEPAIRDYLRSQALPFDLARTAFMSELAVRKSDRGKGVGTALILERLRWAHEGGYTHYAMRTAADGSKSERMYHRLGSRKAPFVEDVSEGAVESASKQRIYLWGEIADALAG